MKVIVAGINIDNNYPDRIVEFLQNLEEELKKYFISVRSHAIEKRIIPFVASFYFRNGASLFKCKIIKEININLRLSPPPVFYDWNGGNIEYDEDGEPAVRINVNNRFAGFYFPRFQSLYATDWSHDRDCVETAKLVLPRLVEALKIKPLDGAAREKALKHQLKFLKRSVRVTLGCDPEFEMRRGSRVVRANRYLDYGGKIGVDGAGNQVELRPDAGTPSQVVKSLRGLIREFAERFPAYELDAAGNHYPCGGHIHIGGIPDSEPSSKLLEILDDFIGKPSLPLSGAARGGYLCLSAWEEKPWGFEYRTPPAAIFANPKIARIVLKLVRNLVTRYYREQKIEYNDHPEMEDYVRVGGLTEKEAIYLMNFFRQECPDRLHMRAAWGIERPKRNLEVIFRDDWLPERKQWFRRALQKKLREGEIVLYGLASSRGFVATIFIPGLQGLGVLCDSLPYPPVDDRGRLWVGLPWSIRMEDVPETTLQKVVDAVARRYRQQNKRQ